VRSESLVGILVFGTPNRFENRQKTSYVDFALNNGNTPDKPLIDSTLGGVALFDFDNDGFLDIFFTNGGEVLASLARVRASQKNVDAAEQLFLRAIALSPDDPHMYAFVVLHIFEILLWAGFYRWRCFPLWESAFYFSAASYATVGYGDVVLPQMWRTLGPVESIVGVLMCGLSASFLFAIVTRLVDRETKLSREAAGESGRLRRERRESNRDLLVTSGRSPSQGDPGRQEDAN
jgi:hypothetical protein